MSPKRRRKNNRDSLGSRFGTVASRVNLAMAPAWMDEKEIAQRAGLKLRKARARLYAGTKRGLYEKQNSIHYRLRPLKKTTTRG